MNNKQLDRFLRHVSIEPNGCWSWTGYRQPSGYAQFALSWRPSVGVMAHRAAYEHFVGDIPEGLVIDHLCRNRSCVNPTHLEPVTQADNVRRGANCRESGLFHDTRDRGVRLRNLAINRANLTREHYVTIATALQVYELKCQRGHLRTSSSTYWSVRPDGSLYKRCRVCHAMAAKKERRNKSAKAA